MTEEMMQTMAFEAAKMFVANNSKDENGLPYSTDILAAMMLQEYNNALDSLRVQLAIQNDAPNNAAAFK